MTHVQTGAGRHRWTRPVCSMLGGGARMVGSGYERGLLPKSPLLPWYRRWKNKVRLVDSCVSGHVQSKETKTQRHKDTKKQRHAPPLLSALTVTSTTNRYHNTRTCPTQTEGSTLSAARNETWRWHGRCVKTKHVNMSTSVRVRYTKGATEQQLLTCPCHVLTERTVCQCSGLRR